MGTTKKNKVVEPSDAVGIKSISAIRSSLKSYISNLKNKFQVFDSSDSSINKAVQGSNTEKQLKAYIKALNEECKTYVKTLNDLDTSLEGLSANYKSHDTSNTVFTVAKNNIQEHPDAGEEGGGFQPINPTPIDDAE